MKYAFPGPQRLGTFAVVLVNEIVVTTAVNLTYVTRRFCDASLNPERCGTDVLERHDDWVVGVTKRIFEVIVTVQGNVECWNVISYNTV